MFLCNSWLLVNLELRERR